MKLWWVCIPRIKHACQLQAETEAGAVVEWARFVKLKRPCTVQVDDGDYRNRTHWRAELDGSKIKVDRVR